MFINVVVQHKFTMILLLKFIRIQVADFTFNTADLISLLTYVGFMLMMILNSHMKIKHLLFILSNQWV